MIVLVDSPDLAANTISWITRERREWLNGRYVSVNWDMQEVDSRKAEIGKGAILKMRMVIEDQEEEGKVGLGGKFE
jgi:hypothetical protein